MVIKKKKKKKIHHKSKAFLTGFVRISRRMIVRVGHL